MIRGDKRVVTDSVNRPTDFSAKIHNRFDIEVIDAKTGELKQSAKGFNTICVGLWNTILAQPGGVPWMSSIVFGSGTGVPTVADTALFNKVGSKTANIQSSTLSPEGYIQTTRTIRLSETDNVGVNLSEIGIQNPSNVLCSHAMLQDMNGNQITITKTSTDIINIYATVFLHFDSSLLTNTNGVKIPEYNTESYLGYLAGASGMSNKKVAMVLGNTYNLYTSTKDGTLSFDVAAKKIKLNLPRVPVGDSNMSGGMLYVNVCTHYYSSYNHQYYPFLSIKVGDWYTAPRIVGEPLGTGDGISVDFATDFNFPGNPVVYVDGAQVAATVEDIAIERENSIQFFCAISSAGKPASAKTTETINGQEYYHYFNQAHTSGVSRIVMYNSTPAIRCSDDLINWYNIPVTSSQYSNYYYDVPEEYKYFKYWRSSKVFFDSTGNITNGSKVILSKTSNVHIGTPPPAGSVITIDYTPGVIAKDVNHVFDFSISIQLGEYTG